MKQEMHFTIPAWLDKMVANNWLGDKTGQGFFKKINGCWQRRKRNSDPESENPGIWSQRKKPKFATVEAAKPIDDLNTRLKMLV